MAQPTKTSGEGILAASANHATASFTCPTMQNQAAQGVLVTLDITTLASTSQQIVIKAPHPADPTKSITLATGTAQTATGTYGLVVYPGAIAAASSGSGTADIVNMGLPLNWFAQIVKAGAGTDIYSVGYTYLP